MRTKENLKHLLALVDDESIEVRENVLGELGKYGHELEVDLLGYANFMNDEKYKIVNPILESSRRAWFVE